MSYIARLFQQQRPVITSIAMVLVQLRRLTSINRTQDFSRVFSALRVQAGFHSREFQSSRHPAQANGIYQDVLTAVQNARAEVERIRRLVLDRLALVHPHRIGAFDICGICRSSLRDDPCSEVVEISLHACQAFYGRECIAYWLAQSPTCPMCRMNL